MAVPWSARTIMKNSAGQLFDYTQVITTGDGEINLAPVVAASTTQEVDVTFAFAKLKAYSLQSDKNCTLKTNSSGAPDETIVLVAGVPQFYPGQTNLFGHDVTKIFVVNGSGAVANVLMSFDRDTSP